MNCNTFFKALVALAVLAAPFTVRAQSAIQEDFTGSTTTNPWWFFNGACLTAGSLAGVEPSVTSSGSLSSPGQVPGCSTIATSYYNKSSGEVLVGGKNGVSGGSTTTLPDPINSGALRFTNGAPYGFSENGGIVSTTPFPTGQGVSVTFKTVTYRGNSGGAGGDGADGISFFLMDASKLNTSSITGTANGDGNGLGAWGGSLGYTCSNSNPPFNGLNGGYVAVGIDEYGNFLNGTSNTLGESGTSATGDNTASGGGYQPGRIGMRGAGNVSWLTLNGAYGGSSNPGSTKPWYPSSLSTSCLNAGGVYNSSTARCGSCPSGYTPNGAGTSCTANSCPTGTLIGGNCVSCSSGTYVSATNNCAVCPSGYTYNAGSGLCTKSSKPSQTPSFIAATSSPLPTSSPTATGNPDSFYAVQATCRNGLLYNYATANSPVSVGATSLTNSVNTGNATATPAISPILDYAAIPGAYVVLPSNVQIANESALKRGDATPIFYQLKITQNGLLSLSYSTCPPGSSSGCGAFTSVINRQNITTSNGPLPANFLFGFAGSTGGSTNIHEILCFRADPATSAASSAGASEKQSAKLENGIQAYFAYYNPSNGWTGRVTASSLGFDGFGNVVVAGTPNWDASCILTGVPSGSTCSTTGQAGQVVPQAPTARTILSWNGTAGIPFQYASLSTAQQGAITSGDSSISGLVCNATTSYSTSDRVSFLRGDRTCEVNSSGVGEFRRRSSVLADVMDSSPIWVGVPTAPYTATWKDRINSADALPENATGAGNYPNFVSNNAQRTQVVYVGANDGLLHGFRSGFYDLTCTPDTTHTCYTNNDGLEVLAYMPGAVVNTIHSTTANVDYSNTQYGHNYFVNTTPGTGDLFYGTAWHTWLVSGLGAGGKAIFALDITNPGTTSAGSSTAGSFAESNAASLVIGEWTSAGITCVGNATCGTSLGNTFGTPQIRRLHNGNWAFIFGNGYGSQTGDAGIFVGVISNPLTTGVNPTVTFYYLSAGSATAPNDGIAYVTPTDLDGDHMTDYVYAGDLKGNLWRFDLTSATPTSWAVTPGPLFTTSSGQPITTAIVAASGAVSPGMTQQLMLLFGTGQKTGVTNTTGTTYAANGQSLYGVWDWNMTAWNAMSAADYSSLAAGSVGTLGPSNLQQQVVSLDPSTTPAHIDMNTVATVCWAGQTTCTTNNNKYGWFINLPSTQEQVVFNPGLVQQAFTVNSLVPAVNTPTSCSNNPDTGFTYVVQALTGGPFNQVFLPPSQRGNSAVNTNPAYTDTNAVGLQTNATGSSFVTSNSTGTSYLVYETNQVQTGGSGNTLQGGTLGLNLPPNTTGHRLGWVELR